MRIGSLVSRAAGGILCFAVICALVAFAAGTASADPVLSVLTLANTTATPGHARLLHDGLERRRDGDDRPRDVPNDSPPKAAVLKISKR